MEVILKNVPGHLTEDQIKRELRPVMKSLNIDLFFCEKPRKHTSVWVNFSTRVDGEKFLKKHGQIKNVQSSGSANPNAKSRRAIARLHILKTAIFVDQSPRQVEPQITNALLLEKERVARLGPRDPKLPPIKVNITSVACGKNVFVHDGKHWVLTFVEQAVFDVRGEHLAQFGRQNFTIITGRWRMDIPNVTIKDLITDIKTSCFTFILSEPPRFYQKIVGDGDSPHGFATWARKTSVDIWPGHAKNVAGCLVYRICVFTTQFHDTKDKVSSRDILTVTRQLLPVIPRGRPHALEFGAAMNLFQGKLHSGKKKSLPFVFLFQIQALVLNDILHPATGTRLLEAMEEIASECVRKHKSLPFTAQSIGKLFTNIPTLTSIVEPEQLQIERMIGMVKDSESRYRRENTDRDAIYGSILPTHQTWVLKATVTPTRITLSGPDAESKNRVLRDFETHTDYFLRVTFGDEGGGDLPFNPKVSNRDMFDRYRKVLRDGIRIAGRHFTFLGFSHSSLRSHSAWFSAPFTDRNYKHHNSDSIIKSLGDFSNIRIPAKCAARIGQAFSETPYEVSIFRRRINISWIQDVEYQDRVFSDGVGTISRLAMEVIWDEIPRKSQTPTCFQIRLGGIKGMLSLDTRLRGRTICIRKKSMMKFESNNIEFLGICDTASQPLRLYLNRQMIKILEDMGTPDDWFIEQQQKALTELRRVTAAVPNTCTFLEYQDVGRTAGLPRLIRLLHKMDINYRQDRFIKSVVEHIVLQELRLLKHKARIPVDQGVTLFGVMDETGFLNEGEIFVTFDTQWDKIQRRVENSLKPNARVIVTRSPALHPGDIQYVKMVTPPEGHPLRNLQNCIVFSQKGTRDLPSQLSGGDLDGDLYSVIWDPAVKPKRPFPPADYPRANPQGLEREVTRDDIADFFVNFMETDILGLIAIRHQILADIYPEGTDHPSCKALAELHSTAVDYSKTGIPVKVSELPKATRTRPDFLAPAPSVSMVDTGQIDHILDGPESDDEDDGMGTAKHLFHKSNKILGRLYRGIDEQKIWSEEIKQPTVADGPSVWEQFLSRVAINISREGYRPEDINPWRRMHRASELRKIYDDSIRTEMQHYSENPKVPLREVEVFCGSIFKTTGSQSRRERDASVKLKDAVELIMNHTVMNIRDRTGGGSGGADDFASPLTSDDGGERGRMNAVELCWACVIEGCMKVTSSAGGGEKQGMAAEGKSAAGNQGPAELESFKVVAACCLARELTELLSYSGRGQDFGGGYLGTNGHMVLAMR